MTTPPISDAAMDALHRVSTATLTTQLLKRGLRNAFMNGVKPMNAAAARMVGEAFTLRYIPAREDLDVLSVFRDPAHPQRVAVESIGPGQVLVIDSRGKSRAASLGNILATRMKQRGAVGVVTDGSIRDSPEFLNLDFPTYAADVSATTNLAQHHAVDMQLPIGCGEVAVYPGDIIVGDREGVVCLPRHLAEEVALASLEQERLEEFILRRVEQGAPLKGTYPPSEELLAEYAATTVPETSGQRQ